MTTPARTSRAEIEASQPRRDTIAGRIRNSLRTLILPTHRLTPATPMAARELYYFLYRLKQQGSIDRSNSAELTILLK